MFIPAAPEIHIEVWVPENIKIMDILNSLHPQLVEFLDITLLVSYLSQNHVLTLNERQHLLLPSYTPIEKIQKLLLQLESKDDEEQKNFIKAIYESSKQQGGGNHHKIIKLFQRKGIMLTSV